jgi:hypothetical protein
MKAAHELDVNLFQTDRSQTVVKPKTVTMLSRYARMTCGLNEVEAGVYSIINEFLSIHPVFLFEVSVEPRLNVFNNWLPAVDTSRR